MTLTTVTPRSDIAATAPMVPLRYQVSRWDLLRLVFSDPVHLAYLSAAFVLIRVLAPAAYAVLTSLAVSLVVSLGFTGGEMWLSVLVFGLAFLMPIGVLIAIMWWWLARTHAPDGFAVSRELSYDADGIVYREGAREASIPWGAVRDITVMRHGLLLRLSYRPDILIPQSAFADDTRQLLFIRQLRELGGVTVTPSASMPHRDESSMRRELAGEYRAERWRKGLAIVLIVAAIGGLGFIAIL